MIGGTVTISIEDFDRLRDTEKQLKGLIREISSCSEVSHHGKGIDKKTFLKVNTKKVEKILKEYNPEKELEREWIDHVAWNEQVSLYFEDAEGSIEKSLLTGHRHEQLAEIMETIEKLDDLNYADKTLEQLTSGKVKCIDDLLYELQEELGCISEE